jgi:hypothetical protein
MGTQESCIVCSLPCKGIDVVYAKRRDPGAGRHRAVVPRNDTPGRPTAHARWRRSGWFSAATSPTAATTHDARLLTLTPHDASNHTAGMGAFPSSLSRRMDRLASPKRWTATPGTTWSGTPTIRSRGVPEVPIQKQRARCLEAWAPWERWRPHGTLPLLPLLPRPRRTGKGRASRQASLPRRPSGPRRRALVFSRARTRRVTTGAYP